MKKNMSQISASTYKQNIIIIMTLAILLSIVRKSYLYKPALKKSLRIYKVYLLILINYHIHHLYLIPL